MRAGHRKTVYTRRVRMLSALAFGVGIAAALLSVVGPAAAGPVASRPTLVVVVHGKGTVKSHPAGISCPGRCAATFAAGTIVTLISNPGKASKLKAWGGACSRAGVCKVKMKSATAVTAQFVAAAKRPAATKSALEPGAYSGAVEGVSYVYPVSFVVGTGLKKVVGMMVRGFPVNCSPAGSSYRDVTSIQILAGSIRPNGTFAAKNSDQGLVNGVKAKFKSTFSGTLHPATATVPANATGTLRLDITYNDGTAHTCTSNNMAWQAKRQNQPAAQKVPVNAGNYVADQLDTSYVTPLTFSVAPGGQRVTNVTVPTAAVACFPKGSYPGSDHIQIATARITRVGPFASFRATGSQKGVFGNNNATFTYSVDGYFVGATNASPNTVIGTFREDIRFTDAAGSHICTTNTHPWSGKLHT